MESRRFPWYLIFLLIVVVCDFKYARASQWCSITYDIIMTYYKLYYIRSNMYGKLIWIRVRMFEKTMDWVRQKGGIASYAFPHLRYAPSISPSPPKFSWLDRESFHPHPQKVRGCVWLLFCPTRTDFGSFPLLYTMALMTSSNFCHYVDGQWSRSHSAKRPKDNYFVKR